MDMLVVQGGRPLRGQVCVDGAKNSVLPIMAACLAIPDTVLLTRVPWLVDVRTMTALLNSLGVDTSDNGHRELTINAGAAVDHLAHYELVRQMRASICVLGPLLARHGKARVSLPGGCNIGHRPVDLHLQGLSKLGADLRIENGYIVACCDRFVGCDLSMKGRFGPTVTGTCNVLVAAALAKGRTVIRFAAREPEVVDLGRFLNAAGAQIEGLGTSVIEVTGVEELAGTRYEVASDRIEAATFAIAAATTRGRVLIPNAPVDEMQAVLQALSDIGAHVACQPDGLLVEGTQQMKSVDLIAAPYPGIPTDCQAQLMALLTTVQGTSRITDSVFPDRFMHASELMRMGASVFQHHGRATIEGGKKLTAADVMASDLRASAALVIAALAAEGTSSIQRIYHLDRGYFELERKLASLGAKIHRTSGPSVRSPHFARSESSVSDSVDAQKKR